MKRILLIVVVMLCGMSSLFAQGFGYDEKIEVGNGLYRVKSGDFYGVVDKDDKVIVSIEYENILFRQGKALLTKNDVLLGVVDSVGNVRTFKDSYKVHPEYRYVSDGYIIVTHNGILGKVNKWGYITETGEPFRLKAKIKGTLSTGKKQPTLFDTVLPFVDGFAGVYTKKAGWRHIDKLGNERFIIADKKTKVSFRSTPYKGECIMVSNNGVKLFQESMGSTASVKRVLAQTATLQEMKQDSIYTQMIYNEGALTLDSLNHVVKFENATDSIIFIEKPKVVVVQPVVEVPVDTLHLEEDLAVKLSSSHIQANAKGTAYTEVRVKNKSNHTYESVTIQVVCDKTTRDWEGNLDANSEIKIALVLPARFSTETLKKTVSVTIQHKEKQLEEDCSLTIKRYTPVRSR